MGERWLVCGGRDLTDRTLVFGTLDGILRAYGEPDFVACGGAAGADTFAEEWAKEQGIDRIIYPADWTKHGKAAGPIRNQQMLDDAGPTLIIAFPGGAGTADMKRRADAAGVKIIDIGYGAH